MSESVVAPFVGMVRHAEVAMEYGTTRIHAQSSLEVVFRQGVLLLAVVDRSQAVPRIIVPPVEPARNSLKIGKETILSWRRRMV